MMDPVISCSSCGGAYPDRGVPYRCQHCGGIFSFTNPPPLDLLQVDRSQPGIWRYRHSFGFPSDCQPASLGEGNTPLVWAEVFGRKVAFKCEFLNPSGSFKDRGSTLIASLLRRRGIPEALEDSSGNAGASFAAYAARAGIRARIFIPASASGPKRRQIQAYGAELVPINGSRQAVAQAVQELAEGGAAYASHAYLPFNLPGYATAAYETFEQLGEALPGAVVVPAGQGGFLLGLALGFSQLRIAIKTNKSPKLIGVQASTCTPLVDLFHSGGAVSQPGLATPTIAEGVNVRNPIRMKEVVEAVRISQGDFHAVEEALILDSRDHLARLGLYVEPTSAIVWPALERTIRELPDPVVVILTGAGCKFAEDIQKG